MRVNLKDAELFRTGRFWDVLAWLRANDPVHRHPDGDGAFWVLTRYHDIAAVYADHETFSSRYGMRLDSNPDAVAAVSQRMLIVSDPPDHTQLKRVLMRVFAPRELPRIERLVRDVVREVIADGVEAREVDFLEVARRIPNYVVCALMDLPRSDWDWVGHITTDAFEGDDDAAREAAHGEIFLYFEELLQQRREHPGEDLVSRVAHDERETDAGPRRLSDEEVIFNCNGVLAGANETTRYSAAGGMLALAQRPDQWRALREAGAGGIEAAVEEILRWTVPGMHALRTALRPARIGDVPIAVGDRVTLWNGSANRDEAVFPDADRFLVARSPNRHLTFGAGRHLCLGARLARLELTVFVEELLARVAGFELTGEPVFNASNFTWGLRALPLRLTPLRAEARV
jgi:cytochrome P450